MTQLPSVAEHTRSASNPWSAVRPSCVLPLERPFGTAVARLIPRAAMPIDDPDVLLKDPEMSRDFLHHVLGTTPDTDPKPADAKHLEGEDVIIHGLKGRPELDEARVIRVRVMGEGAR